MQDDTEEDTELIVAEEKLESFLPLIGHEVTDEGKIRDMETGDIKTTEDGKELTTDEIRYVNYDEEEGLVLVEDTFPSAVRDLSDREFDEEWDDPREN